MGFHHLIMPKVSKYSQYYHFYDDYFLVNIKYTASHYITNNKRKLWVKTFAISPILDRSSGNAAVAPAP